MGQKQGDATRQKVKTSPADAARLHLEALEIIITEACERVVLCEGLHLALARGVVGAAKGIVEVGRHGGHARVYVLPRVHANRRVWAEGRHRLGRLGDGIMVPATWHHGR